MSIDLRSPSSAEPLQPSTPSGVAPVQTPGPAAPVTPQPMRVVVAISDDDVEAAALSVANALATRRGAKITVLSAFDPARYAVPGAFSTILGFADAVLGPEFHEQRRLRLREHIASHLGAPQPWDTEVDLGDVASCIHRCAERCHPDLVVLGLHRHGAVDRAFGDDTARAVMRRVGVPVLAVRPELTALPTRVVVAVDFSRASMHAARMALALLDEHGTLDLVYVRPSIPLGGTEDTEGLARIFAGGVDAAFTQLIGALRAPPTTHISRIVLEGEPADELMHYAQAVAPDLVAVGTQRHGRVARLLLGSVTSAVVHDGRWSVLVTPPGAGEDEEVDEHAAGAANAPRAG